MSKNFKWASSYKYHFIWHNEGENRQKVEIGPNSFLVAFFIQNKAKYIVLEHWTRAVSPQKQSGVYSRIETCNMMKYFKQFEAFACEANHESKILNNEE